MNTADSPTLRAVLCDLDGTLVDSIGDLQSAINGVLKTLRRRALTRDETISFSGDGAQPLVERAVAATGAPATEAAVADLVGRFQRAYHGAAATTTTRPYPGVHETLGALRAQGIKLAVCTNKPFRPAIDMLARLDLDGYFEEVVGSDTIGVRKPDPAPIQEILRRMAIAPEDAAMVGDSAADIGSARNAKVPSIAVSYGYAKVPAAKLGAKIVIDRFDELPAALTRIHEPPPPMFEDLRERGAELAAEAAERAQALRDRLPKLPKIPKIRF